jgi:hypothetical protein
LNTREIQLITGSRDATREAFKRIDSGWGTMDGNDKSRNQSTYLSETTHTILNRILNYYYDLFVSLKKMKE